MPKTYKKYYSGLFRIEPSMNSSSIKIDDVKTLNPDVEAYVRDTSDSNSDENVEVVIAEIVTIDSEQESKASNKSTMSWLLEKSNLILLLILILLCSVSFCAEQERLIKREHRYVFNWFNVYESKTYKGIEFFEDWHDTEILLNKRKIGHFSNSSIEIEFYDIIFNVLGYDKYQEFINKIWHYDIPMRYSTTHPYSKSYPSACFDHLVLSIEKELDKEHNELKLKAFRIVLEYFESIKH